MLSQKPVSPVNKRTLEFSFYLLLTPRDLISNFKKQNKTQNGLKAQISAPSSFFCSCLGSNSGFAKKSLYRVVCGEPHTLNILHTPI